MTRFEASQITADKHVEAQLAFNEQVSSDLTHLRRQMDLTQADVDEVRQQRTDHDKHQATASAHQHQFMPRGGDPHASSATPLPEQARGSGVQGPVARLVNEGPPLIPHRPAVAITGAAQMPPPASPRGLPQAPPTDDYHVKPPKHDFPKFDGTAPYLWIDRCESYFELYRVPQHNWVTTAALYIEGHAAHWLQAYRQAHRALSWEAFCQALKEEFGPDEFELEMHKLLQLRQTGTVAEYRLAFETHMYHLLALDATLSNKFFITQFLLGLRDDLRAAVRLQAPTSITRASVLARIQEEENNLLCIDPLCCWVRYTASLVHSRYRHIDQQTSPPRHD